MAQLAGIKEAMGLPEAARAVSWLPMAHIAERACTHYFPIFFGWSVTTCADPREVAAALAEARPVFFFSPPRLWEKLRAGVLAMADDEAKAAIEAAIEKRACGRGTAGRRAAARDPGQARAATS